MRNRAAYGKSGLKGVYFDKHTTRKKPWKAETRIGGKKKHLGYFKTKEEAYIAIYPYLKYT